MIGVACFRVLLRVGFFKKLPYKMSISGSEILFEPVEQAGTSFSVHTDRLKKIFLYRGSLSELEIQTQNGSILVNFESSETADQAAFVLKTVFNEKFTVFSL
ncbi:hypothetical protein AJ81_03840 [Pseudothermotoga hypogea DSM 11164 = NBRC 106472]|uniref:Uncharacterized protein n=1 Tax=Pseudothermotoga hypogea DSM 11164 = NBRC 106472 TaxID=1123384 RepID=A0A0X1KTU1_9THEM|nr:hypothetical protein AJ81_03840 [Pseudothermotoga hypogea DSM 11164 = NBRC 106472]